MNVISDRKETIYRKDFEDRKTYSIGLAKKKQDGTYENGYMNVVFNKGVELENKTLITIKSAWIDFYIKDKKTYPYIRINDFEIVGELKPKEEKKDVWESAKNIEIEDDNLPFY